MDRFHRYYQLHGLLKAHRLPVPRREIEARLECSRATALRVIDGLRGYGAPIEYDREANGYRYATGTAFELPGLWFSPSELVALLATQRLLAEAEPGLLRDTLAPLRRRVEQLLRAEHLGAGELARRVRIERMAGRGVGGCFEAVALALAARQRLGIVYHGRGDDTERRRTVSPQRLTHYRDNWYLDAWCHSRRALRSFALERIRSARPAPDAVRDIGDEDLDRHLATAYGIFAGEPIAVAVLRFAPERARWVAEEQWHPRQEGRWLEDGGYELRVPYSDARELVMDVLRHGAGVEVVGPKGLREMVVQALERALGLYSAVSRNEAVGEEE